MSADIAFIIGLILFAAVLFVFLILAWIGYFNMGRHCAYIFAASCWILSFLYVLGYYEVGYFDIGGNLVFVARWLLYSILFGITGWCLADFLRMDVFWSVALMFMLFATSLFIFAGTQANSSVGHWVVFGYSLAGSIFVAYILLSRRARRDNYSWVLIVWFILLWIGYVLVWILYDITNSIGFALQTWFYLALDVLYFLFLGLFVSRYRFGDKCAHCHKQAPCKCGAYPMGSSGYVQHP